MALKNVEDIYPLSPMQRLMLLNAVVGRNPSLLANQLRYDIRGPLRADAFRRAWEALVHRHGALRTGILWDGLEQPVQVVRKHVELPFDEVDLSGLSDATALARIDELTRLDAERPYDLASAPLMRCTLVRMSDEHHVFVWNIHHLVVDRWSHGTLFADLAEFYRALVQDEAPDLAPAASFREYIALLAGRDEAEAEDFWREELRGFHGPTLLGDGAARGGGGGRRTSRHLLPREATALLLGRASAWRVTPASLVLAGVGVELAVRTGSADVVLGLTVSGRPPALEGVEQAVGSFVNNVPMRLRLESGRRLSEWVRDVQLAQLTPQSFDHVSLATIHDVSEVPPHEVLFDVLVVPNLGSHDEPTWPALELRPVAATFDAGYPLVLGIGMRDERLELALVHDSDFDGASDVLDSLGSVLDGFARVPTDALVGTLVPVDFEATASVHESTSLRDEARDAGPTSLREALVEIWRDVLGIEQVDMADDFFDVGGTSLQAAQILRRVEGFTGRGVSLSALFEARTVGGLLDRLGEETDGGGEVGIPSVPRVGPLPLSFAQERLWVLDQIEEASSQYNLPVAYRLDGELRPELLRRSVELLVERHEVLRTHYPVEEGQPYQAIAGAATSTWGWGEVDLGVDADASVTRAHIETAATAALPLDTGPLFRVTLFQLGLEAHVLLFVMHHSIADAWSIGVLERELSVAYAAVCTGEMPTLAELSIQYADFAVWQRKRLQGALLEDQLSYWRDRLDGVGPLELPTDRPRPLVQTFRGALHRVALEPAVVDALKSLGRAEGTTLYMTLMAAFHVLLYRYSGKTDITVGTPYSGRSRAEVDGLIGMFVNTVVIRSRPTADVTFRELLEAVREASMDAHSRQDLPFEKLVEELSPERDLSRNPLFQVMFALQDTRGHELHMEGLRAEPYEVAQHTSKFDLTLFLQEVEDPSGRAVMEGLWEYATDLFDESTVERMQGHFVELLGSIAADPGSPISELRMISDDERRLLLGEHGGSSSVGVPEPLFLSRFAMQCERGGDRVAVSDGEERVTYEELDSRSNRLARRLVDLGAKPETIVGICVPRSADLVVAMLAVLKSGAAYLPLDPDYPSERLAYMVADAEAAILITTTDLLSTLPSFEGGVVCLDQLVTVVDVYPDASPEIEFDRDQLAYTIYTSGSTGRPKGVDVSQGNLAHSLAAVLDRPGLSANDVVLAKTSVAFDPSVVELLATLTVGARMVIARADEVSSGPRLSACIAASGATLLQATPATFHMLFEAGWAGDPELRVLVGGEALSYDVASRLVAGCREVWNLYGPTEGTVWASAWKVPEPVGQIRIGTAMGATSLIVLDGHLQPVPIGVTGELYVGGEGVTRGYRGKPDLTAENFVSNPFPWIRGACLYRTGDLGRVRADGTLECFGRSDNQVQVRGFRIELGEIEGVLVEHEGVRRAVVTVVDAGTPDARLVAYVILGRGVALTASEIRRYLRGRLPDYMVPGLVVELDDFPTTPSGKVDRRAMPSPLARDDRAGAGFEEPQTPEEVLIAEIWQELLGVERIGRHDNFFQLGGHSLLSLRATAMITSRHGHALEPRAMFFLSLEQLASRVAGV